MCRRRADRNSQLDLRWEAKRVEILFFSHGRQQGKDYALGRVVVVVRDKREKGTKHAAVAP